MIETIKSIKLSCMTGGHDKVYNLWVNKITIQNSVGTKPRYEVVAEYGKRLGVLKKIIKGNYPNAHQAVTAFDDLVDDKRKKGYVDTYYNKEFVKSLKEQITSKPLKPLYILKVNEEYKESKATFKQDKPTITIPQEEYIKLLAGISGITPVGVSVPAPAPAATINGRKFRDE